MPNSKATIAIKIHSNMDSGVLLANTFLYIT